jgi:hypothetical protein
VINDTAQGVGWLTFAGIMVLLAGLLNGIWGIAAIDSANFFLEEDRYIFSALNTWGWIIVIIGVIQVVAASSIWAGGQFGAGRDNCRERQRDRGAASIPGYPFWSLAVFGIDLLIIYGLSAYGGQRSRSA